MHVSQWNSIVLTALGLAGLSQTTQAQSILVLNGNGLNAIEPALTSAGFNVVNGTLAPGQIASNLAAVPDIVEIWIWSDYTYGNGGIPADPLQDFNAADFAALDAFNALHPHWIMDGLAWRQNAALDEINLTINEALNLQAAGGGIVLGTDDDSGGSVVQHPNAVAAHFGFDLFAGHFLAQSVQFIDGAYSLSGALPVDVTNVQSTSTYSDAPHGIQPNGMELFTAIYSVGTIDFPGASNPTLEGEVVNGVFYDVVSHMITTSFGPELGGEYARFCAGDGTATSCPCGNAGATGRGCDNSVGTGGGELSGAGTPALTLDDFTLQGTGMIGGGPVLYFQGSGAYNAYQGIPFGDGLLCAGGVLTRLAVRFNSGGASDFGPLAGDGPISTAGAIPSTGGTYFYQGWYRDSAVYCSASTHNLTNGLAVTWRL